MMKNTGPGAGGDLAKMNDLATQMVMQQAMKDKLAQHEAQQQQGEQSQSQQPNPEHLKAPVEPADDFEDDPDFRIDDDEIGKNIWQKQAQDLYRELASKSKNKDRKTEGVGEYVQVDEEKFFLYTTNDKYVVCHFYHQDFNRCKILDHHLSQIAYSHPECKFISVDVEKSPFIVKKLQIQTLPTVVMFIEGRTVDRIVGFEDLGGSDEFKTPVLTRRLAQAKVLVLKPDEEFKITTKKKRNVVRVSTIDVGFRVRGEESSDED